MLLLLLAMATLFGGADEAWDINNIVLAEPAVMDDDLMEEAAGEAMDGVVVDGVLTGGTSCMGIWTGCICCGGGGGGCTGCTFWW